MTEHKKALEIISKSTVVCDNTKCTYEEEVVNGDYKPYINKPCPLCGENLLTQHDYNVHEAMMSAIQFLNKNIPDEMIEEEEKNGNIVEFGLHYHEGNLTVNTKKQ